jgi:hypothetical protein
MFKMHSIYEAVERYRMGRRDHVLKMPDSHSAEIVTASQEDTLQVKDWGRD